MTVLIIHTQSRLRVLGASERQAFPSLDLFVLRPFCPQAFLSVYRCPPILAPLGESPRTWLRTTKFGMLIRGKGRLSRGKPCPNITWLVPASVKFSGTAYIGAHRTMRGSSTGSITQSLLYFGQKMFVTGMLTRNLFAVAHLWQTTLSHPGHL